MTLHHTRIPRQGFRQRLDLATKAFRRYQSDENGSMVILAVFMFLMILMMGGIGVDLMRSERDRTILQHTLDRAVLAAADLDQQRDPTVVVNDYFNTAGLGSYLSVVDPDVGLNYKTISAQAQSVTTTAFMKMAGVDTLSATASGTAEERVANVEISLVLDVSLSMLGQSYERDEDGNIIAGTGKQRIERLQTAAKSFVNTVLKPSNAGLVSVSLIPYSSHVNAGPLIFDELNVNSKHNYSHCLEFPNSAFNETDLDTASTFEQMQHFQWNYFSPNRYYTIEGTPLPSVYKGNSRSETQCPRYSYERITPFSQDPVALNAQIDQLVPRGGTQIFLGMKWAAALLDPSMRSIISTLSTPTIENDGSSTPGPVDQAFDGRPAEFNDIETLKTIILMTDGKNSSSGRINSNNYSYSSQIAHWNNYNFNYYFRNRWSGSNGYHWTKYTASQGDTLLSNICTAAKALDKNIVIWTIGFEVDSDGASVMQNCASTVSHFFRVEGVQIEEAFDAIARQINMLRLTQ